MFFIYQITDWELVNLVFSSKAQTGLQLFCLASYSAISACSVISVQLFSGIGTIAATPILTVT